LLVYAIGKLLVWVWRRRDSIVSYLGRTVSYWLHWMGVGPPVVDINHPSKEDLEKLFEGLRGINPAKLARRIIAYLEQGGAFERVEDIKKITGIGEKTFKNINYRIKI